MPTEPTEGQDEARREASLSKKNTYYTKRIPARGTPTLMRMPTEPTEWSPRATARAMSASEMRPATMEPTRPPTSRPEKRSAAEPTSATPLAWWGHERR